MDDLVVELFRELAVFKGQRDPDGNWVEDNIDEFRRTLHQATLMAKNMQALFLKEE